MAYLLVLISTMTPPEMSGATRSGRPAEAGCLLQILRQNAAGIGPRSYVKRRSEHAVSLAQKCPEFRPRSGPPPPPARAR